MKPLQELAFRLKTWINSLTENPITRKLMDLEKLMVLDFRGYQDMESLCDGMPIGTKFYANGNLSELLEVTDDYFKFRAKIKPSQGYGIHWHPQTEECFVESGELVNDLDPHRVYGPGDSVVFEKNTEHIPQNPSATNATSIIVVFYRKPGARDRYHSAKRGAILPSLGLLKIFVGA